MEAPGSAGAKAYREVPYMQVRVRSCCVGEVWMWMWVRARVWITGPGTVPPRMNGLAARQESVGSRGRRRAQKEEPGEVGWPLGTGTRGEDGGGQLCRGRGPCRLAVPTSHAHCLPCQRQPSPVFHGR